MDEHRGLVQAVVSRGWVFCILLTAMSLAGCDAPPRVTDKGKLATESVPVMGRILGRRLAAMYADTSVRRLTDASTPIELLDRTPLEKPGRLDDSSLVKYFDVFSRSLDQVSDTTCAKLWDPAHGGVTDASFLSVAAEVDSALAVEWVDVIEQQVWAELRHRPFGETASREEADAAIAAARKELPATDQALFVRNARGDVLSGPDRCQLVRAIFHGYNLIPLHDRARVLRRNVS